MRYVMAAVLTLIPAVSGRVTVADVGRVDAAVGTRCTTQPITEMGGMPSSASDAGMDSISDPNTQEASP